MVKLTENNILNLTLINYVARRLLTPEAAYNVALFYKTI